MTILKIKEVEDYLWFPWSILSFVSRNILNYRMLRWFFLVHSGHNISKKLLPSLLGFFWMCDYFPGFTLGFMSTPIHSLTIDAAVSYQTATRALFQIIRNLTFWDSTLHFCSILSLALKKYLFDLERCQNSKTSAQIQIKARPSQCYIGIFALKIIFFRSFER